MQTTEIHQQHQKRIGFLVGIFKNRHYDDWKSLLALSDRDVDDLCSDSVLRIKFKGLLKELPR